MPVSPMKLIKLQDRQRLPAGYFRYLAVSLYWLQPLVRHAGNGPPSGADTPGAAAATYVHTSPSIRTTILTARFIGFSPWVVITCRSWEGTRTRPHYTDASQDQIKIM